MSIPHDSRHPPTSFSRTLSYSGKVLGMRDATDATSCSSPLPGSTQQLSTFTSHQTHAPMPARHGRRAKAATPEYFEPELSSGIVWVRERTDFQQSKRSLAQAGSVSPQRMRSQTTDVPSRYLDHSTQYAGKQCMQSRRRILQDSRRSQGADWWLISDEELVDPRLIRRSPEPRKLNWTHDTDAAPARVWNSYTLERDVLLVSPLSVRMVDVGKPRKASLVFEWAAEDVRVVDMPTRSSGKGSMREPYGLFEGRAQGAESHRLIARVEWSLVYNRDENKTAVCVPSLAWEQVCSWHRSVSASQEPPELVVVDAAAGVKAPRGQRPPYRLVLAAESVAQVCVPHPCSTGATRTYGACAEARCRSCSIALGARLFADRSTVCVVQPLKPLKDEAGLTAGACAQAIADGTVSFPARICSELPRPRAALCPPSHQIARPLRTSNVASLGGGFSCHRPRGALSPNSDTGITLVTPHQSIRLGTAASDNASLVVTAYAIESEVSEHELAHGLRGRLPNSLLYLDMEEAEKLSVARPEAPVCDS